MNRSAALSLATADEDEEELPPLPMFEEPPLELPAYDEPIRSLLADAPRCACYGCSTKRALLPGHELTCALPLPEALLALEVDGAVTRSFTSFGWKWREASRFERFLLRQINLADVNVCGRYARPVYDD